MHKSNNKGITTLIEKGVTIPAPTTVDIDGTVNPDNISGDGVVIHAGCKLAGADTFIGSNAIIGREGPVTIDDCQVGPEVELKGGYFQRSAFLKQFQAGLNAHVREGSLCEEQSSLAHTVGIKQTILFPFATLGSLINFCDCLLSGGTSRKNHSEVGSSFIHFNYSPNQDKATPSLFGDVPRGVMLREAPIFLGGQGGAVGPLRLAFGTVTAAGTICRKDEWQTGRLIIEKTGRGGRIPYQSGIYMHINRVVSHNINYVASLTALLQWYQHVRRLFIDENRFPEALLQGAIRCLESGIAERLKRIEELIDKMPRSLELYQVQAGENASTELIQQKIELFDKKDVLMELLAWLSKNETGNLEIRDRFLVQVDQACQDRDKDYLSVIKEGLTAEDISTGTIWLRSVLDSIMDRAADILPSLHLA